MNLENKKTGTEQRKRQNSMIRETLGAIRRFFPDFLISGLKISHDQHAVAVAEETVLMTNCLGVGFENEFPTRKGADEHQER